MEIGVTTFAELATGGDAALRMARVVEEAELTEAVGLDLYGVGEHHRPDFIASAPAVVLAAIAARTERIRLTSAVTVLSSDDPVRVFQDFATLDLLSGGRAEIMAGRGSFIESFPLFGHDLDDYDDLFAEKLELLLAVRDSVEVTWSGRHRAPIEGRAVYPRPVQDPLPVWIAVGGTPRSVARAGHLGLPLTIAIIGGEPARFAPLADLYRQAGTEAGHDPAGLRVSINSHTYVAETSQRAADEYFPAYAVMMNRIGRERGWAPMTRAQFDALRGPDGALMVGDPDEVAAKIVRQRELFGHDRFTAQISVGPLAHPHVMRSIELLGTEVAPRVRAAVAGRVSSATA
jgi:probable LLM family oxidoreductase